MMRIVVGVVAATATYAFGYAALDSLAFKVNSRFGSEAGTTQAKLVRGVFVAGIPTAVGIVAASRF